MAPVERRRRLDRWLPWMLVILTLFVGLSIWLNVIAFSKIRESRLSATEFSCEQVNERHDKTLKQINSEIDKLPIAQRASARKRSAGLIRVFEASVPFRDDCRAYAEQVVSAK